MTYSTTLRLVLSDISLTAGQSVALRTARASRYFSDLKGTECGVAIGSCLTTLRLVICLLLMMVVGVSEVWGHPFTLTTADDVTNGTETLYWIESKGATGFFAIPHTDDTRLSTSNMPNERMLWYFMDANTEDDTENGRQYYYIVNKSTGKYMKLVGNLGADNSIQIATFSASDTETNKDKFRFTIGNDSEAWVFFPKSADTSYWVNKQSGSVPYNSNDTKGWFKASNYNKTIDDNSRWYFVAKNSVTWAHPFTNSTNSEKHYYTIHNATANGSAYYMSTDDDSDPYATISNEDNSKRIWYFVEAASDNTIPNLKYYYIVNAVTGKYLKFIGTANGNTQANSLRLYEHTGSETGNTEDRFQFMVLNAKGDSYSAYSIMPKLEISYYYNRYTSLSPGNDSGNTYSGNGSITLSNDMKIGTYRDRGQNNNYAHWLFVETDYVAVEAPTITNNFDGTITLSTATDGATIYYTTNGDTPDNTSTAYSSAFSLGDATVIKAIAYLGAVSSDVTTYNVPQYTTPTITFDNTTSQVTITCTDATGIYYTTGDGSQADPTISSTPYSNSFDVASPTTVKAIATHAGYLSSEVATLAIAQVATPTITINTDNSVTIACATDGATIYYKTGGDDPTTANGTQSTSIANILPSQGPIKAFAIKDGLINSNIATESNIPVKTITVSSSNGSLTSVDPIVYDGTAHQPAFTITDGETPISSEEYTSAYSDNTNAGTATITITDNADGDYKISGSFTFTIAQKALTITADDKSIFYGSTAPTYTFSYSGFVNNEDATALTTAPTATCSYTSTSNAGTYDIVPSGGEATNYSFTYENGTLTVDPKTVKDNPDTEAGESAVSIVLTDIPVDNFTYDGTAKTPTITVKDGETVIPESEYTKNITNNTNAGTVTVTITDEDGGNYNVSGVTTFTINPAALTITPDNGQGKQFGDPDPALTYTNVGLVEGDALAGALARAEGENAGNYAITQGTIDDSHNPNYTITFTTGKTFVITPKSLGDDTDPAENITIEITEADADHVVVKQGGKTLREGNEGTNYDYSISAEGDATTKYYKVTITGRNNYEGSFQATFANLNLSKREGSSDAGGAATFVSNSGDGDFAVPDDMVAYIVTGINAVAGTIVVEPLDNIPEQVPVLLISAVNANGFVVTSKNDGTNPTGTNLLIEATGDAAARTFTTAEIYLLYKGEFVLNAAGTLPVGKVYLQKPSGETPAPAILSIDWGVTSGIDNSQLSTPNSQLPGTWYTLEGIKLSGRPTKRGLYLRDGKKTIVK